MPETDETQDRLLRMELELREVHNLQRLIVASNPATATYVEGQFKKRVNSPELFLALADGPLAQPELETKLNLSHGSVSIICNHLSDAGLIDKYGGGRQQAKYFWTKAAKLVRASEIAEDVIKGRVQT